MKRLTILLCGALILASCSKIKSISNKETIVKEADMNVTLSEEKPSGAANGSYGMASYKDENVRKEAPPEPTVTNDPIPVAQGRVENKIPAKIIRNANVKYQVDSTDISHGRIVQLLAMNQAYFGADSRIQYSDQIQQNMTIRVPAENFDKLLDALMRESIYTNSKNITADDVTSEFVDVEARLKSKKEVEKRYLELLARAQKVTDVIEVESNLRLIREEIESTEGRLKLLKDQVSYSTIELSIYQKTNPEVQPESGIVHRIKEAISGGWNGLVSFLLTLVNIWPLLIVGGLIVSWIIVRRRKKN